MMLKASLLAFVALLAVACAAPSVFLGGEFTQLDGVWSPGLGAFNTDTQTWSHYPIGLAGNTINSLAAVRNGTFAVGSWTHVGSSHSQGVAFWDGVKWCPIRQSLIGTGLGVVCDSDSSCWVAGDFTGVVNVEVETDPRNFVHYVYNSISHEWELDLEALNWNNATSAQAAPVITADTLDYVGSGTNQFFFALSGGQLYRGGAADDGWFPLASAAGVHAGASILYDYSINPERSSLYVVTNAAGDGISVLTGTKLSSSCVPSCATPTTPADWNSVVTGSTPPYNATVFNSFTAIVAGPSDTRFLIGMYDPDGEEPYFIPRQRVLQQTGSGQPTLLGAAFAVSDDPVLTSIHLSENNGALVVGSFTTANLFYPETPSTNDIEGLLGDRRPLDFINGIAVYDEAASRWVPFGGGGVSGTPLGAQRLTYNSLTKEWYVADDFGTVYNTHAVSLAYHETTEDAFFPVLTRALLRRGTSSPGPATVYEVVCESSACDAVFVGGDFTFHGPDTFGAILRAVVKTSGEPELTAVGGGLWDSSVDYYLNDTAFQVQSGQVAALKVVSGHLYAGGEFTRTHPSAGFHCLNNIARIDASNLNGQWEDLAGGCDNTVFDIEEFQGRLYVGGQFAKCGDVIVNSVASYSYGATTPAWSSLNHGVNGGAVYSLEPFQGRLIVGGSFTHAGGLPVTGVASWDGTKWRALVPACSDDCVPGDLRGYYNVPEQPTNVWGLQRDSTGRNLFATGEVEGDRYLVRWHYTEGDFGQWLVKGVVQHNDQDIGHSVAIFVDNQILVAGSSSGVIGEEQPNLGAWDQNAENIAVTTNVGGTVYVARGPAGGSAGSASTLSSMLSPLLAYVF